MPALPTPTSGWLSELVYEDADVYFSQLLAAITASKSRVYLDTYIFSLDSLGDKFLLALIDAAKRGVEVKLIVDGIGSLDAAVSIVNAISEAGEEGRIFHPAPWSIAAYRWSIERTDFWQKAVHFLTRINRRNHRKLCVIDSSIAWCGSRNIDGRQLSIKRGGEAWKDFSVKLQGPGVEDLEECFLNLWLQRPPRRRSLAHLRSNLGVAFRGYRNRQLLQRIYSAKSRIWIVTAYFAPARRVLRALRRARRRGVDVCVIVAKKSDVAVFPLLTASYYRELLAWEIKVYEYQSGILHVKLMIADDIAILGSSNLNHRSFLHDIELDVVLQSAAALRVFERSVEQDIIPASLPVDPSVSNGLWRKLLGFLLRPIRYWM